MYFPLDLHVVYVPKFHDLAYIRINNRVCVERFDIQTISCTCDVTSISSYPLENAVILLMQSFVHGTIFDNTFVC